MTYTISEPEIIDMVKTTTYLKDNRMAGRLKELPEEKMGDSIIRPRSSWFIAYARTWDAGKKKEPKPMTRVDPELIGMVPLDVDRVEIVFLNRIHERYRRYYLSLTELKELCLGDFEVLRLNVDMEKPKAKSLLKNEQREKARDESLAKIKRVMELEKREYIGTRLDKFGNQD